MRNTISKRMLSIVAVVVFVVVLPYLITAPYGRSIMIVCCLNIMLALSLNLVLGYTGQLNLGQSGFYATGAYVSVVLVKSYGWNFWLAMLTATGVAGLLGVILALFAVRLRGHYLGIASLGFAVVAYQVIVNWQSMTEGVRGIYGIMPPTPIQILGLPEITFANQQHLFYLLGGSAILVYLLLDQIVRSPIGQALRAIREDEVSAASLGIDSRIWKVFTFAISSGIAGFAGSFYPIFLGTLVPDAFGIVESFSMLAMVIVGGLGTMLGPVIGAVTLTVLPELLREFGEMRLLVYGLSLTLVVIFMPGGIVQGWKLLITHRRSKVAELDRVQK